MLYAALFALLQSEDLSLLLGSVGLFIVVSVVMFATRRLNWYALSNTNALTIEPTNQD